MQNHNGALLRGDPRMNRAVQLKLQDPGLSLGTCLRLGGFRYPPRASASTVDPEMITFRQRRNQLGRRVKQAKQLPNERDILQASGQYNRSGACKTLTVEPELINAESSDINAEHTKTSCQGDGSPIYPYTPMEDSIPELQIRYPRPVEGSVKSGCFFDDSVAAKVPPQWKNHQDVPRWNQDHVSEVILKACQQTKAAEKQAAETNKKDTALSPCDSNQHFNEAGSTRRESDIFHPQDQRLFYRDQKIGAALDVFGKEMRAFTYQKAMIMAGYSMEECKVSSKTFQEFAFYAWAKETERLSGLLEKQSIAAGGPFSLPNCLLKNDFMYQDATIYMRT